jgi:uncharacterized protein (TIGR00297 family)
MLFYPAAVFLTVLLFWQMGHAPHVAAAAWALLAVGDGLATVFGKSFGWWRLPWNREKSYAGSMAFLVGGIPAAAFFFWFVAPRTGMPVSWPVAFFVGSVGGLIGAAVESFPWRINDNLSIPLIAGANMYLLDAFDPQKAAGIFENPWKVAAAALLTGALLAFVYHKRLAELPLVIVAWFLGFFMILLVNLAGFILLGIYFAVRYLLTVQIGEQSRKGNGYEVWDVALTVGLALFFAFWSRVTVYEDFFLVAMTAALATALADTAAAQLGQLYGGRPYMLPSFRRVPAGTPGAVSLAGTLYGIVAALVMAFAAWVLGPVPGPVFVPLITIAALVGITWESAFGPSLIRRGIRPHTLNLFCTLAGSLAGMVFYWLAA